MRESDWSAYDVVGVLPQPLALYTSVFTGLIFNWQNRHFLADRFPYLLKPTFLPLQQTRNARKLTSFSASELMTDGVGMLIPKLPHYLGGITPGFSD